MKPVPGIVRVTVKKSKNILFVISKAKIEDLSAQAQASAAQQVTHAAPDGGILDAPKSEEAPKIQEVEDDDAEIDEEGIEPKDIELVTSQVSCSRAKAVAALRANNNDIVEAIMQLSSS